MFNKKQAVYYPPLALEDSKVLEWIELSPETKDTTPGGEDGDQNENPLG